MNKKYLIFIISLIFILAVPNLAKAICDGTYYCADITDCTTSYYTSGSYCCYNVYFCTGGGGGGYCTYNYNTCYCTNCASSCISGNTCYYSAGCGASGAYGYSTTCKCSGCSGYCSVGGTCYYNDACGSGGESYSSGACLCTNCASYCIIGNTCNYNTGCGASGPLKADSVTCKCSGCSGYCPVGGTCYYNDACGSGGESYNSCTPSAAYCSNICTAISAGTCGSGGCSSGSPSYAGWNQVCSLVDGGSIVSGQCGTDAWECKDSYTKWYRDYGCSSGSCTSTTSSETSCGSTSCSADTCSGVCGTGTNSCVWRDYPASCSNTCSGGTCYSCSCSYTDYDVDTSQTRCEGCSRYWSIGGNVSTTTCCGDDSNENKITKTCKSGVCTNNTADDGCCASSSQCVNNSICFANATSFDIDDDTSDEFCSDGMWKTKVLKIETPSASPDSVNMYNGTTDVSVTITDADSNLDTTQVKISIRNPSDSVVVTNATMQCTGNAASATCNYTYDPPESSGYYDVQIYATDGIAPRVSSWVTNVFRIRGPVLYRGFNYQIKSANRNENYNYLGEAAATAAWYLNGTGIATGMNTTWAVDSNEKLGAQTLNITVTKSWYDSASATKDVEIWDMPKITLGNITDTCPGYGVSIKPKLQYSNAVALTSQPLSIYVKNTTNNVLLTSSSTDSQGYIYYSWDTSAYTGTYTINVTFPGNLALYAETRANDSVNISLTGKIWGVNVTNSAQQQIDNSEIYLLVQGGNAKNAADIIDYAIISTETKYFETCFGGTKDFQVDVPTDLSENVTIKFFNVTTTTGTEPARYFSESEYTGYNPISGNITKMLFVNNTTFGYAAFNLTIPYDSSQIDPDVYLHCLNFDFANNNCTSWDVVNLTQLIEGGGASKTSDLIWIYNTSLDGGGCGHRKADLLVNNNSINENNTSPEAGESVDFTITVWNIGDRAAPNVNVSCYYNGTYFDSDIINSIPPDVSQQTPRYANCTWTALEGTYNISAKADPDDEIDEYHENNNEGGKHIVVRGLRINVTTNKTAYNASETVNATGYFTYVNGTGLSGKAVNVTFFDYANSVLQSRNVTTIATGFFNDTYTLAQFIKSGVYTVNVTGYSLTTKQNTTTYQVYGATYGQQQHSPATYSTSSITQTQGASFDLTITWNNQGPDTAKAANITFAANSTNISVNSSLEQCGNILTGSSCTKTVNVTIAPGTSPASYHINSTVTWKNNNTVTNTSVNTTNITVGSNKILYVPETVVSGTVTAGVSKIIGYFTINSTGNDAVNSIDYEVTGGNLSSDWVTFSPAPLIASIVAGTNRSVLVNITAPSGASGNYWTNISVTSLDGGSDWLWLNVTIGNMVLNLEAGGPYIKTTQPTVVIVGNVSMFDGTPVGPATVVLNIYEGATLKASRTLTTSSVGKFATTFNTFDVGTYDVNASATYGAITIYATDTFKIITGSSTCTQKTVSLNGTALDFSTGQLISSGTVKIAIKENGDTFQTSFTNGRWIITFVSCLDSGRRYTATIQVIDSVSGKSSWSEMQFMVP